MCLIYMSTKLFIFFLSPIQIQSQQDNDAPAEDLLTRLTYCLL